MELKKVLKERLNKKLVATMCIIHCYLVYTCKSPRGLSICDYLLNLVLKYAARSYTNTLAVM